MFNSREDKILVVGAHWDTTGFTDGYNDNGSGKKSKPKVSSSASIGVAAMIDVARALVKSKCQLKYSIIFVAFDKEEVDIMMVMVIILMVVVVPRLTNICFSSE